MPRFIGVKLVGNALRTIEKAAKQANAKIMAGVNKAAARVQRGAKINVKQVLNTTGKSTGALGRSIGVSSNPAALEAEIGPSVIYGRIHELGGVIKPVHAKRLAFEVDGEFRTATTVTIPPRPYLGPALEEARPQIERDLGLLVGSLFVPEAAGGE